ncbi:hypothetical protein ACFTSF_07405 [Kribbella sp. NPDC056951]|uniref:hypothetical protein n=1 Tax=Kribbella sp. NPDC056951 TaxID=3345978 RepID=UPI00362788C7
MLTSNGYVLDERRLGELAAVPAPVSRGGLTYLERSHHRVHAEDHAALDNVSDVMRLSTDIRYKRADDAIDSRWQAHWHDQDGL